MIIFNAGGPRSGTVLVNAILRQLFRAHGLALAQSNPHGAALPPLIRRLIRSGEDRHRAVIVHTHSWDDETAALVRGNPHITGFVNFRDPRDVCVSLMRLHDHDFEAAAAMVDSAFAAFEAVAQSGSMMTVPYEHLVSHKPAYIFQMARHIGFWIGLEKIDAIDAETSVERHRAIMEQVNGDALDTVTLRQNVNRVLREDAKSLINDRHIQSGAFGRWRTELSAAQQAAARDRFAPLIERYGYPA